VLLDSVEKLDPNLKIGSNVVTFTTNKDGSIYGRDGSKVDVHEIIISEKVIGAHVKKFIRDEKIMAKMSKLYDKLTRIEGNKGPEREVDNEVKTLLSAPYSAEIYLPVEFFETSEVLMITIAHELMHSWGGLFDRYKPSLRFLNQDNLMGNNLVCKLEIEQINNIFNYRKYGQAETWYKVRTQH